MQVEWHQLALEDRDVIVAYLELLNPNAASSVLRGLVHAGDSLALFPARGRLGLAAGTRELVAVWPYLIVYEVDMSSDTGRILRIWHEAQDRP
ncbi:type II toxin-antitoxin system RelE/ParE family toxin [Acidithiobacillus ferriphilus]|jgi:plasmid stabilization system protein ParE|uniref:type II toxin-antitoxin system RelE/ParE family toxin n=1 Tax=Acidithiobacillus ferriphilus TaxID=1689834 RepID=UPI00242DA128|nr:type II toxin-antitoxin system RelE/ParE family toxin [Acidithiobacillus ferriphilus]MBW9255934.1 type II toxin-antitoxin system RelE/ParE family toxin [Acidithiobacillus ferriphilus]